MGLRAIGQNGGSVLFFLIESERYPQAVVLKAYEFSHGSEHCQPTIITGCR
jgi:hypothetical protein